MAAGRKPDRRSRLSKELDYFADMLLLTTPTFTFVGWYMGTYLLPQVYVFDGGF